MQSLVLLYHGRHRKCVKCMKWFLESAACEIHDNVHALKSGLCVMTPWWISRQVPLKAVIWKWVAQNVGQTHSVPFPTQLVKVIAQWALSCSLQGTITTPSKFSQIQRHTVTFFFLFLFFLPPLPPPLPPPRPLLPSLPPPPSPLPPPPPPLSNIPNRVSLRYVRDTSPWMTWPPPLRGTEWRRCSAQGQPALSAQSLIFCTRAR